MISGKADKGRGELYKFISKIYKLGGGPVLVEALDPRQRQLIADEYGTRYEKDKGSRDNKLPYIFQVNCSTNLVLAQGLFAIGLEFEIKKATDARNLKYVIQYVLDYFQHKNTLFILLDLPELNKFTRQFLKQTRQMPKLDLLIISPRNEIHRMRLVVANYDQYKVRGIEPIINKLNPGLRRKYLSDEKKVRDYY